MRSRTNAPPYFGREATFTKESPYFGDTNINTRQLLAIVGEVAGSLGQLYIRRHQPNPSRGNHGLITQLVSSDGPHGSGERIHSRASIRRGR